MRLTEIRKTCGVKFTGRTIRRGGFSVLFIKKQEQDESLLKQAG